MEHSKLKLLATASILAATLASAPVRAETTQVNKAPGIAPIQLAYVVHKSTTVHRAGYHTTRVRHTGVNKVYHPRYRYHKYNYYH